MASSTALEEPTSPWKPRRKSVASWIIYDTANTIFSFNILSAFFPVWLTEQGLPDSVFAIGNSVSMAIVMLLAPFLGALSDRARRRVPFLIASTVLCVLFTIPLGLVAWPTAIVFFVLANLGFQTGLIFYDALLSVVSTQENRGRIGSWGIAVGYLGSLIGLGLGALMLRGHEDRDALVFAATGLAFLVLAFPAFLFVREPPGRGGSLRWATIKEGARTSAAGLARLLRGNEDPKISRFLLGRALYTDAANTMIVFMGVYALQEAGLSEGGVRIVLLIGILGAFLGAPGWGWLVDRRGPAGTLLHVVGVWLVGLGLVVAIPTLHLPAQTFYAAAFVLGAALGGTWSADRPLMLRLAPPERLGEFYGIYAMVGRFSAVLGPLMWALVVDGLHLGRPVAVATLAVFMVAALVILRPLARSSTPALPS